MFISKKESFNFLKFPFLTEVSSVERDHAGARRLNNNFDIIFIVESATVRGHKLSGSFLENQFFMRSKCKHKCTVLHTNR